MPSRGILDRLSAGETLLMDGATGSELQRRGVDVSKGATKGNLGVWSATANLDGSRHGPRRARGILQRWSGHD